MNDRTQTGTILHLVVRIVKSYLSHHKIKPDDVSAVIISVHRTLRDLGGQVGAPIGIRTPAVPIEQSVRRDNVVCLECGLQAKTIRLHLMIRHRLTPDEYRARWGLPADHPITAAASSQRRSAISKPRRSGKRGSQPKPPHA